MDDKLSASIKRLRIVTALITLVFACNSTLKILINLYLRQPWDEGSDELITLFYISIVTLSLQMLTYIYLVIFFYTTCVKFATILSLDKTINMTRAKFLFGYMVTIALT